MPPKSYPTDLTDAQWDKTVTLFAKTFACRQTAQVGDALNHQRYFLYSQIRVSVANAASSDATMANGLFPLQKVENFRYMGYDSSSTSRANP